MESAKNCCTLEIFYRALRGEWISVKKIAEEYQVSTKTIGRYINEIQQFLSENRELMQNAELLYSHKEKAYYLHANDFLENKELFALVKVVLGCRCFQKEDLLNLIAKLKRMTTPKDREQFENLIRKELYHYHEIKSDCNMVIDYLWKLIQAIEDKQILTITYYKMNREQVKRKIRPASILFSEYYFYLIAYDADDETCRAKYFRVDRIVSIVTHRERFSLKREYDFDEGDLREKNQFMFPGKTEKIRFSFSGLSVQAILDRLPTAKVVEKNGKESIIEAEVNHGRGIIMYLLSQGAWVKVLSPQSLVDEIREELQKMQSFYQS